MKRILFKLVLSFRASGYSPEEAAKGCETLMQVSDALSLVCNDTGYSNEADEPGEIPLPRFGHTCQIPILSMEVAYLKALLSIFDTISKLQGIEIQERWYYEDRPDI